MEKESIRKNGNTIVLIVMIINFINLLLNLYGLIVRDNKLPFLLSSINGIIILYYALFAYKKPHGNLLKYVMGIFAINVACFALTSYADNFYISYCYVLAALLITYICGRLDREEQNLYLFIIVLILFVVGRITASAFEQEQSLFIALSRNSEIVEWIAMSVTYHIRYKTHKQAGIKEN